MIKEVIMPKLGQTMEEGIIEKWRKKEGERVEKGDILLDITTDKATLEVESYVSGLVKKIIHQEGETVPVAKVIAYIGEPEDEVPSIIEVMPAPEIKQEIPEKEVKEREEIGERIKASPAARRIAREKKIDISLIKGTGPGGRITEKDVLDAKKEVLPKKEASAKPISPIRRIIGERMSLSKREIPHYYLTASLDMHEVIELRKKINQETKKDEAKVSYNDFLIKAVALTIREFPSFNTYFEKGVIKEREAINIGLAVAIPEGIIVPVIRNAAYSPFMEIVKKRQELVEKARTQRLFPDEYSGGSFTISNLGAYSIESFCAIINPPECAILAVGSIADSPVVLKGEITIRPLMKVTLSLDHRVIDGVVGAGFLQKLKELIELPGGLMG
jgi:pyruvate dehydrogenase E2 component (dihydrolipoamide acetyltransferase)